MLNSVCLESNSFEGMSNLPESFPWKISIEATFTIPNSSLCPVLCWLCLWYIGRGLVFIYFSWLEKLPHWTYSIHRLREMKYFGRFFFPTTIESFLDRIIVYLIVYLFILLSYCAEIQANRIPSEKWQTALGWEGKRHYQTVSLLSQAAKALSSLIILRTVNKDGPWD